MSTVTAVIVTYNSGEFLAEAVHSCHRFGIPVVIVDNASTDGTVFPEGVTLIQNETNRGFAAAVNQGVRAHSSPTTLLLNPDAQLLTDIGILYQRCGEKGYTAATGLLVGPDGTPQKGFSIRRLPSPAALAFEVLGLNQIWPDNPVNRAYRCADVDLTRSQLVEQPAGALFVFRRDDWEQLGGFDERFYPVWFEDVDFAKRLLAAGGRIVFEPSVRAMHAGGHSVGRLADASRIRFWYGSLLRYVVFHFGPITRRLVAGCVLLGLSARCVGGVLQRRGSNVRNAHLHSILLSARCVFTGNLENR